jgi:oligopeptidase B
MEEVMIEEQIVQSTVRPPVAERISSIQYFGNVNDNDKSQIRGLDKSKLIDPAYEMDDPYFWMRGRYLSNDDDDDDNDDDNEAELNPKITNYIEKENKYAETMMSGTEGLQNEIYDEFLSRIENSKDTVPALFNGWYYWLAFESKDSKYPIHYRSADFDVDSYLENPKYLNISDNVILDVNELARDKDYCDVGTLCPNKNNNILVYSVDNNGSELYNIFFLDLETNELMEHSIENIMYGDADWGLEDNIIYFTRHGDANRINQIWCYDLNTKTEIKIYEETNILFNIGIQQCNSGKFMFITSSCSDSSKTYFIEKSDPHNITLIRNTVENVLYSVEHHEDYFYILTNEDNCVNFKLMKALVNDFDYWEDVFPYNSNHYLTGLSPLNDFILIHMRIEGKPNIGIMINNEVTLMEFDDPNYEIDLIYENAYESETVLLKYQSLITPKTTFRYNCISGEKTLIHEVIIPEYNKDNYEMEYIYVTATDGSEIPVSILKSVENTSLIETVPMNRTPIDRGYPIEQKNILIEGYGAYGLNMDCTFQCGILSLLDRGFTYAIAHVRGGDEKGYNWYLDGKMANKINTFTDFISVSEYFADEGYQISAVGRSAGGLLMGAVMTMRPELFHSILAGVPFVDALNSMVDSRIPLTVPEWKEWGNPNETESFQHMMEYSPYDNIRDVIYPNLLITSSINDPRVQYWEPTKFLAKLRYESSMYDKNVQIMRMRMNEGHFGGSDLTKTIKERAYEFAFLLTY